LKTDGNNIRKIDFKKLLLGAALPNEKLKEEKLSVLWGLPIMSSDAVSSVAYAVEEILMALVPALGLMAVKYVGLVSIPIIVLLTVLIFSYTQIITHYPGGGGAYIVSRENFGKMPALIAASALIVDYIMTITVSISSATAAIVASFPSWAPYALLIALVSLGLITLVNLRGTRESSKIFGIPTYLFIVAMAIMLITGLIRAMTGTLHPIEYTAAQQASLIGDTISSITLVLFLHAFSAGCTALTGVEAVSNTVPNFKEPSVRTAKRVLYLLGIVIFFIFGGTCLLATVLKVVPMPGLTVMSQMATVLFGQGFMFYLLQFSTALILVLAANTAYNGLPVFLSILGNDHFMPHQFTIRGAKLSFSNGILFVFGISALLLIGFNADTHRLIPFYAVGVFLSFTLSQGGMLVKWFKEKEQGWKHKMLINLLGAIMSGVGTIIVFSMKFTSGAWALLILLPSIIFFMNSTSKHYSDFADAISVEGYDYKCTPSTANSNMPYIILINAINRAALKTLNYAKRLSTNVTALHISGSSEYTEDLQKQWANYNMDIPLTIIEDPYRNILPPLETYISVREGQLGKGEKLTVLLTKFVGHSWRDRLLYNQTTYFLADKLSKHEDVVVAMIPYVFHRKLDNKEPSIA